MSAISSESTIQQQQQQQQQPVVSGPDQKAVSTPTTSKTLADRMKIDVLRSESYWLMFARCVLAFVILIWIFLLVVAIFTILSYGYKSSESASTSSSFTWTLQENDSGLQQLRNNNWVFTLSLEGMPVVTNTTSGQVFYLTKQVGTQLSYRSGLLILVNDVFPQEPWEAGIPPTVDAVNPDYLLKLSSTGELVISSPNGADVPLYTFSYVE